MKYVNNFTGEVIDEDRYEELVEEEMELYMDEGDFERWIDKKYSAHEIFAMCEMERQEVYDQFYNSVREDAIENINMDCEPIEEEE